MACLSQEQLARLALGLTEDADLTAHLQDCASCRARGETMRSLVHQLTSAHAKLDSGHEEARERLMAILPASRPLEPTRSRNRITHWIGELTMRQRIALGGIGAVVVLAILLVWLGIIATPVSAMEQMAESIRKAKSYKATMSVLVGYRDEPEKPFVMDKQTDIVNYWIAPGSTREEASYSRRGIVINNQTMIAPPWKGPGPETTKISPAGKQGILIDHRVKTFIRHPARQNYYVSGFVNPEDWGKLSGEADHELGTKLINGKKALGFEIDIKKISPEYPDPGIMEIWINTQSNLPVHTCLKIWPEDVLSTCQIIEDFQWNIDLDPKLFDPTPPEGYTDATPKPPALEEQVRQITEALRIYSKTCGGHYPRANNWQSTAVRDLSEMLAAKGEEWVMTENGVKSIDGKYEKLIEGTQQYGSIQSYNPDAAYYGKTVEPGDKDKVLLRWKLDDGKYAIIFGDLHTETVTAEQLHALEVK
jgi:outer membrane lipoprotein-sorting protein